MGGKGTTAAKTQAREKEQTEIVWLFVEFSGGIQGSRFPENERMPLFQRIEISGEGHVATLWYPHRAGQPEGWTTYLSTHALGTEAIGIIHLQFHDLEIEWQQILPIGVATLHPTRSAEKRSGVAVPQQSAFPLRR
jgi:hypothetical protein